MPTPQNGQTQLVCLTILWGSRLKKGFFCRIYNLYVCIQRVYEIQSIIHK